MVCEDAQRGKRNLSMAWIDVAKAYDSVDHGWLSEMFTLHRFPIWFAKLMEKVANSWNTRIIAQTTTVIDKTSKQVREIEMSCSWLENRESKDLEKTTKYSQLRLELTNRYSEYKVNQYNIIMDVLGGCSKEVEKNIKELVGDRCESIMQNAILSSSLHIARMFKLSA